MTDERRCTAHLSDGTRRCRNAAIRGGTVCRYHGGAAPQVQLAARQRLDAMVEPALDALQQALDSGDIWAAMKAARLVLDRAGYGPTKREEIVQLQETHGRLIAEAITGALVDLGIDPRDTEVRRAVSAALVRASTGEPQPKQPRRALPPADDGDDRMVL